MAVEVVSKQSTRDRIAAGALALFNAKGIGRVTTAEIAAAAGIREGNLHYHYPRKSVLLEALFAQFETAALAVSGHIAADLSQRSTYVAYQRRWFDLIWAYRCFYRDGGDMLDLAPELRERVQRLRRDSLALARTIFQQAVDHGLMQITPDALTRLMDNIWIVSSYWMNYRGLGIDLTETDLEWGFSQIKALVAPYMAGLSKDRP